ncbi:hypothetical protein FS764_16620 [Agrobacterium vitis]|uniref:hypothetical protein n=1 Tax=Agrobacterium vitis TaxID=373 RepID=UPI0008DC05C6|nr:hypothetical protein [Agrobacterium vitis]MCF1468532.1 hypothetical protein [Agrobacterium vitis]MUO84806.1 hypothetical protein [Agrobacterium vitis]
MNDNRENTREAIAHCNHLAAQAYCNRLIEVTNAFDGSNMELVLGLMTFFDKINARDKHVMPLAIGAWQSMLEKEGK